MAEPATEPQLEYLIKLYKRRNLYLKTLDRERLVQRLKEKEGIDLDALTFDEASAQIARLEAQVQWVKNKLGLPGGRWKR